MECNGYFGGGRRAYVRGSGIALSVSLEACVCQAGSTDFEVCVTTLYAPPPLPGRPFDPKGRPAWLKKPLPLCGTPPWGSAAPPRYSMPPKDAAPERLSTASARRRALITDPRTRTALLGRGIIGVLTSWSPAGGRLYGLHSHYSRVSNRSVTGWYRRVRTAAGARPRSCCYAAQPRLPGVPRRRTDPARFNLTRC